MKNLIAAFLLALCFIPEANAFTNGQQGPFIWTYHGDPTNVSTSIINPYTGAIVINPDTAQRFGKITAAGNSSGYFENEWIVSGSNVLVSGSLTATGTLTINANPTAGDTITTGTIVYTFVPAITGTNNQIAIGANTATTGTNVKLALITSGSSTGQYGTSGSNGLVVATNALGIVSITATTSGTAGNTVATTGSFASTGVSFGATTLTGGATAAGTNTVYSLPANAGKFVLSAEENIYISGTGITTSPTVSYSGISVLSGTQILTGSTSLSGTVAGSNTHMSALTAPGQVIDTGTTGATVTMIVTNSGTTTNMIVKPVLKLEFIPGY